MRCPECQSEAVPEHFRCGVCSAEFATRDAEELDHLAYVQTWLRQSCSNSGGNVSRSGWASGGCSWNSGT